MNSTLLQSSEALFANIYNFYSCTLKENNDNIHLKIARLGDF